MIFITTHKDEMAEYESDSTSTPYDHFKASPLDRGEDGQLIDQKEKSRVDSDEMSEYEGTIRCIRISPDGTELASGNGVGNIRIHSLESPDLAQTHFIEAHDSEVISLAYSSALPNSSKHAELNPNGPHRPRFLMASGGRDKQVLLFDSEDNYHSFMNLDHHASTITALQFNEYSSTSDARLSSNQPEYRQMIELISSSADKNLACKQLDLERFNIFSNELDTAATEQDRPLFKHVKTQICKDKVMSLDVAGQAQYMVTGHDKSLCLWKLPTFEKVWEKRLATMEKEMSSKKSASGVN